MFKNIKQLWRSVLVSRWFAAGHWGRPHLWDSLIFAGASPYFHIIKLIQSKPFVQKSIHAILYKCNLSPYFHIIKLIQSKPFVQKSIHAILYKCNLYTKNRVMGRAPHRLVGKREGAISGNHLYRHEHVCLACVWASANTDICHKFISAGRVHIHVQDSDLSSPTGPRGILRHLCEQIS